MNNKLEHKSVFNGYEDFTFGIDEVINRLDQKHYLERKVKFLLDVRGYLKTNALQGNYIEFGSYRSEMQYTAYKILSENNGIKHYIGLDTFEGEPKKNETDKKLNLFDAEGDFGCDFNDVSDFVINTMNSKGILIKGDFRDPQTIEKLDKYESFVISIIDCNLLSSVEAAFEITISKITEGGLIYFDDFFYNIKIMKEIISLMERSNKKFIEHSFYPPFAKSFVVVSK